MNFPIANNMNMNMNNQMGMNLMNNMNQMGMNNMNQMGMNNMMQMAIMNFMNNIQQNGMMANMNNCGNNMFNNNMNQMGMANNMMNNNINNNMNNNMNTNNFRQMMGQMEFNRSTGINSSGGKEPEPDSVIPRMSKVLSADFFKGINDKINVVMSASSGLIVTMPTPPNVSIQQLLRNYISKLGLPENVLGNAIIFILNAEVLQINDQRPIGALIKNNATITVVDVQGVIAA